MYAFLGRSSNNQPPPHFPHSPHSLDRGGKRCKAVRAYACSSARSPLHYKPPVPPSQNYVKKTPHLHPLSPTLKQRATPSRIERGARRHKAVRVDLCICTCMVRPVASSVPGLANRTPLRTPTLPLTPQMCDDLEDADSSGGSESDAIFVTDQLQR